MLKFSNQITAAKVIIFKRNLSKLDKGDGIYPDHLTIHADFICTICRNPDFRPLKTKK